MSSRLDEKTLCRIAWVVGDAVLVLMRYDEQTSKRVQARQHSRGPLDT
jgi:hypothetical protein